MYTTS